MTDEIRPLPLYQPPKYELLEVLEDGTERRRYPNGAIRNQNGQLLELPKELENTMITSENALEYRKARKAKIIREIEKTVMDITSTSAPAEAIAAIVGKRARVAMTDETRTGNEAAKIVLQAIDAYQDKEEESKTQVTRHEYHIDDETRELLERIARDRRNIIDIE